MRVLDALGLAVHTGDLGASRVKRSPAGRTSALTVWGGLVALLVATFLSYSSYAKAQDITTWHYNAARTGVQSLETTLTPANVNASLFGKTFSLPVLGDVYAQPLYLKQVLMGDGQLHNVLIVATQEDYVYAFDADGNNPAAGYLWRQSLLGSGETWVLSNDVGTTDIAPNIGITGTPVIDRTGGTIYVVAKSKTASGTTTFYQRLHALKLTDGTEKLNGPTSIAATVSGLGDGGTTVSFSPLLNNQRPGLLLAPAPGAGSGNAVVIGWSSHGDNGAYHGWLIAYDAADISKQTGAWTDTPNGNRGGIWMSGGGPALDSANSIYAADGNGSFDANAGNKDYGDSAFRMTLTSAGLTEADSFTPSDQSNLNGADNDMGTSAVLVLPPQSGSLPDLLVTTDKTGTIYLVNRDKMGGYTTPNDSSVQNFSNGGYSVHSSFAFFNNNLYEAGDGGPLQVWGFNPQTELFTTTPQSRSSVSYGCNGCDGGGSTPSISANGTTNGIVWALDNSGYGSTAAILHAYDPGNLANEFYNSTQAAGSRDAAAIGVKFTTPTIANGRVYVGGRSAVTVYGLLSTSAPLTATPTFSPAAGTYTAPQTVTISSITPNASIYYTTDGTPASTGSTLYAGALKVNATETIHAIAIAPGYAQSAEGVGAYTINQVVAPPVFSPAGGTYATSQSVTLTDATSGAVIYYTTNGSAPTTASSRYTGAITVSGTTMIKAIAAAAGETSSGVVSATYGIGSTSQTQVSLSSISNAIGIFTDGSTANGGGLDGDGNGYSGNLLGSSLTVAGVTYNFGLPSQKNVIRAMGAPVVAFAPGHYTSLNIMGTAVNGNQLGQPFTVTYTDGSSATFTQNVSDWYTPQRFAGESIGYTSAYRDTSSGGKENLNFNLYNYAIPLSISKTVKSLTLPNNANIAVVAITLSGIQTQVSLASAANATGIYTDGTSFTTGGIDGTSAYSANLLGSAVTYQGVTYNFHAANQPNVVKGINGAVINLTPGTFLSLKLLATGVNGSQAAQSFTVAYSDGSTTQFTQSFSDWSAPQSYPGESTALATAYRDLGNGTENHQASNLYQYTFSLNSAKTVQSLTLPKNANVVVLAVTLSSGS